MLRLLEDKIATPLGPLWVIADEAFNLRTVEWEEHSDRMVELLNIHYRAEGYERITTVSWQNSLAVPARRARSVRQMALTPSALWCLAIA